MELIELKGHTEGPWVFGARQCRSNPCTLLSEANGYPVIATDEHHGDAYMEVGDEDARLVEHAPSLLEIANELANKLAMAGQPAQAFESFASRGIKPPALVMREALGYDEPPQSPEGDEENGGT